METQQDLLSTDLSVTAIAQEYLLTSAKWGKFLAIVGFIGCAIMVIMGVFFSSIMASNSLQFAKFPFPPALLGILYVVIAAMMFFPCIFLYKFSAKMKEGILTANQESFETGLENMKSMFKFYGILTMVVLGFYALAIVVGIVAAFGGR